MFTKPIKPPETSASETVRFLSEVSLDSDDKGRDLLVFNGVDTPSLTSRGGISGIIEITSKVPPGKLGFVGSSTDCADNQFDSSFIIVQDDPKLAPFATVDIDANPKRLMNLLRDAFQHFSFPEWLPPFVPPERWLNLKDEIVEKLQIGQNSGQESLTRYPRHSFCKWCDKTHVRLPEWTSKLSPEFAATVELLHPKSDLSGTRVDELIKEGAILRARREFPGSHNSSPLMCCGAAGALDAVKALMERHGQTVLQDTRRKRGRTSLLHEDAHDNNLAVVRYVLEKEPEALHGRNWEGATPLHRAASRYNTHRFTHTPAPTEETIKLFLEKGADINAQNESGETPLTKTVVFGHSSACEQLLRHGADVNVINDEGKNMTVDALYNTWMLTYDKDKTNRQQIIDTLLDHGIDVASKSTSYNSQKSDPQVSVLSAGPYRYISNLRSALSEQLSSLEHDQLVSEGKPTSLLLRIAGFGLIQGWIQKQDHPNLAETELKEVLPIYYQRKYFS